MINPANPDYTDTPVSARRPRFGYVAAEPTMFPCATIVTPFYNTGAIFHETAQSVLQQSLQQWEWLIINDGTTDPESLSLLDGYRYHDPRIRVLDHRENSGLSAARNTGFRAARTPYVIQLDSDDLLEPTAVEKWVWFLESYPEFAFVKGYGVGFGAQTYVWEKGFHNGSEFLQENIVAATSAVRKSVHHTVGGYDETIRGGLEDWDFWLRCANAGYWGGTLPEYLDWYRRRASHDDRWSNWGGENQRKQFRDSLQRKYPRLWKGEFPQLQLRSQMPNDTVPDVLPWENRLGKDKPRLLLIVPWLTLGGADKFNLDMLEQLTQRGWEITIATTAKGDHSWLPAFARSTPDIFMLQHFLRTVDHPRFLHYLIQSRNVDVVVITNSEMGYMLLPYLRAHHPMVTFLDFCHMEEEAWKNGGYPRYAVEYQEQLDLNVVSSAHLQNWMITRGAQRDRIRVCYTNIDVKQWQPGTPDQRKALRDEFGIAETLPLILFAGRLSSQKQPRVFAHTMLHLTQAQLPFVALVAGDGPEGEWLRLFLSQQRLEGNVRLLGAVASDRMHALLAAADIFFLPSEWEGIALSLYEAMACAVPVVSAHVGGQCELVTPACGVLVERSDEKTEAEQYAHALTRLLKDPTLRQQMGRAGRLRVEQEFPIERMANRMIDIILEAQSLNRSAPRPVPALSLGFSSATRAVEYARLVEVADGLWQTGDRAKAGPLSFHPYLLDPHSDSWRTLAYFTVRRMFLPSYRRVLSKNAQWLRPLKDKLKRTLLGGE